MDFDYLFVKPFYYQYKYVLFICNIIIIFPTFFTYSLYIYQNIKIILKKSIQIIFAEKLLKLLNFIIFVKKLLIMGKVSKELVGASAAKIILSVLAQGDSYGYDMLQKVKELSNKQIKWNEGSIYPVLKKMETLGLIRSYWIMQDNERPRKYYNLLDAGKAELQNKKDEWNLVNAMLTKLWNPQVTE